MKSANQKKPVTSGASKTAGPRICIIYTTIRKYQKQPVHIF